MKELCILIGAGASAFHSKKNEIFCPPLGINLARAMRKDTNFKKVFATAEKMVAAKRIKKFEVWMNRFIGNVNFYSTVLWCLSGFFLKYNELPEDSFYLTLIEKLGQKKLSKSIFISLNYESLFEIALRKEGYKINWGTDVEDDKFNIEKDFLCEVSVFKPHGSSNFRQSLKVIGGNGYSGAVASITGQIESEVFIADPKTAYLEFIGSADHGHSVISAYEPKKRTSYSKRFIIQIRENLKNSIKNIEKTLIIGISCNKDDSFLNEVLGKLFTTSKQVGYIGDERDYKNYLKLFNLDENFFQRLGLINHEDNKRILEFIKHM